MQLSSCPFSSEMECKVHCLLWPVPHLASVLHYMWVCLLQSGSVLGIVFRSAVQVSKIDLFMSGIEFIQNNLLRNAVQILSIF